MAVSGVGNDPTRDYSGTRNKNVDETGRDWGNLVIGDEKDQMVKVDDFLNLMVAQMQNQDFMNPMDDTQYVTQLAQFATMQQMQELAEYSKQNYVMSLVGKTVTASKMQFNGDLDTVSGVVEKVSLVNSEYKVTVNGKTYDLSEIMEINKDSTVGDNGSTVDPSNYDISAKLNGGVVELSFPAPSSDRTVLDTLKYEIYYSEKADGELKTLEDIDAHGQKIMTKDMTDESNKGKDYTNESINPNNVFESGKDYYINIVVTDEKGVRTIYKQAPFHME